MSLSQNELLKNWHLKLVLIGAIVVPSYSASSAYFELKGRIAEVDSRATAQIAQMQLQSNQQFADKQTLKELQIDQRAMHDDILEMKTFLFKKLK